MSHLYKWEKVGEGNKNDALHEEDEGIIAKFQSHEVLLDSFIAQTRGEHLSLYGNHKGEEIACIKPTLTDQRDISSITNPFCGSGLQLVEYGVLSLV